MALEEDRIQSGTGTKQLENERQWITKRLQQPGVNTQFDEIQCILHFALPWNLFEGKVCGTHANTNIHEFEAIVKRLKIQGKLKFFNFESALSYFRSRYITDGKTNDKFDRLRIHSPERKLFVSSVLESLLTDLANRVDEVVLALMVIVHRLRNNFFPWVKSWERVHTQAENFHVANEFLIHIIDLAV